MLAITSLGIEPSVPNAGKGEQYDWPGKYDIEKIRMTGFVAQDVETAARSVGYDFDGVQPPVNETDLYSLRYSEFVVPLVKAVQEQQQIIEEQQKQIDELRAIVNTLTGK